MLRRMFIMAISGALCALIVTPAAQAADNDYPLFPIGEIRRICNELGGTFTISPQGWNCALPNGEEMWCVTSQTDPPVCGHTPAPPHEKPVVKKTRQQLLAAVHYVPGAMVGMVKAGKKPTAAEARRGLHRIRRAVLGGEVRAQLRR